MTAIGQWLKQSTFTMVGASLVAGALVLMPVAAHADSPSDTGWPGNHAGDIKGWGGHASDGNGFTGPHSGRDDGNTGSDYNYGKPCVSRTPDGGGKTVPPGTEIVEDGPGGSTIHLVCDGATGQWAQILDVTAGSKVLRTPSSVVPKLQPQVYNSPIH